MLPLTPPELSTKLAQCPGRFVKDVMRLNTKKRKERGTPVNLGEAFRDMLTAKSGHPAGLTLAPLKAVWADDAPPALETVAAPCSVSGTIPFSG